MFRKEREEGRKHGSCFSPSPMISTTNQVLTTALSQTCLSILLIGPTMELESRPRTTEETGCDSGEPEICSVNLSLPPLKNRVITQPL